MPQRPRRRAFMASAGPVPLALNAGYDTQLYRLAGVDAWRLNPAVKPGLLDRAGEAAARVFKRRADPDPEAVEALSAGAETEWIGSGYFLATDVAVILVEGVLAPKGYYDYWDQTWVAGYADFADALLAAQDDSRVSAILFHIDSPGGIAYGLDELAATIRENSSRTGRKPVIAFCDMAYSAAQEIAASCDACYAPKGAGVGSIGVRLGWFDFSAMMEKDGVKREEFTSGQFKDMGSPFRPVTDEERTLFAAQIEAHAGFFFEAVSLGRDLSVDTIRSWEALTWTVGATNAAAPPEGLIDAILNEREAFEAARLLAGAGTGRTDPADNTAAADKENSMGVEAEIAALRTKAAKGDEEAKRRLAAMGVPVTAPKAGRKAKAEGGDDEEEAVSDDEEEAASDDDEEEASDEEEAASDDDEEEASDEDEPKSKASAGRKIARLANAQGKPKLGGQLAADVAAGETSYRSALRTLKSAARESSPLASAMGGGREGLKPARTNEASSAVTRTKGLMAAVERQVKRKQA